MATNYGIDTYRVTDRQLVSTLVTSPAIVIGQRVARAWGTPQGQLAAIGDDPLWGLPGGGINQYINRRLSPNEIASMQANLEACAEYDAEVETMSVTVSFTRDGSLAITGQGVTSAGPFGLTGNVSEITGEMVFDFSVGP